MANADDLWRSASNLRHASPQLNAILSEIESLIEEPTLSFLVSSKDWTDGYLSNEPDQWLYPYYWFRYPIRIREENGKRSRSGFIVFAISLWRPEDEDGRGWVGAQSAKLYVGFSPKDDPNFSQHLHLNGSGKNPSGKSKPPYLWLFGSNKGNNFGLDPFFFCMPLLQIESRQDLKREAIEPLSELLKPGPANQKSAFSKVRFCYKIPP